MSVLTYFTPFSNQLQTQVRGVGKIILAGKLAESAWNIPSTVQKQKRSNGAFTKTKTMPKRTRKVKGSKKLATVSAVRRMLSQVVEKKQLAYHTAATIDSDDIKLVHSVNMTAQVVQGTADGNRVGDSIFLQNLTFNMTLLTFSAARFYRYRIIVGWSGEEYNNAGIVTNNLSSAQILINSGSDVSTQVINTKAFTPLYDQVHEINSQLEDVSDGQTLRVKIPLNQKFDYQSAGSTFGKKKSLYVCLIPDCGQSSPANLGGYSFNAVLFFKDA